MPREVQLILAVLAFRLFSTHHERTEGLMRRMEATDESRLKKKTKNTTPEPAGGFSAEERLCLSLSRTAQPPDLLLNRRRGS